jgi:thiamine-phosphate pyrophosphorylase
LESQNAANLPEYGFIDAPMTTRPGIAPAPRLYILTPPVSDPGAMAESLAEASRAIDVAAVLLRLPDADERGLINMVKAIARGVQHAGAALLVDNRPGIVARAGADGAHLAGPDALKAAIPGLKPNHIAGVGRLHSRHDAMVCGEAGADYVMFGEPDAAGQRPSREAVIDRVAWWAEVFEIPCVAYAAELGDIDALVAAGADFIAVGDAVFEDPRGLKAAVADAAMRLGITEQAT